MANQTSIQDYKLFSKLKLSLQIFDWSETSTGCISTNENPEIHNSEKFSNFEAYLTFTMPNLKMEFARLKFETIHLIVRNLNIKKLSTCQQTIVSSLVIFFPLQPNFTSG
jgi:hypothetical protein